MYVRVSHVSRRSSRLRPSTHSQSEQSGSTSAGFSTVALLSSPGIKSWNTSRPNLSWYRWSKLSLAPFTHHTESHCHTILRPWEESPETESSLRRASRWTGLKQTQPSTRQSDGTRAEPKLCHHLFNLVFPIKGAVHPKMKMCSPSGHPRSRRVCFFIRFAGICLCISVSAMDALQWMGAVRMRVW